MTTGPGDGGRIDAPAVEQHRLLMDRQYRWQRHVYDLSRKYYLPGRDRSIDDLGPLTAGQSLLEVGCGTGRNLIRALRRYPAIRGFGVDISEQMLDTARVQVARASLQGRIVLAQGDATSFDALRSFGRAGFDRVMLSYTLSMIPAWEAALEHAMSLLAPGGRIHVVDFGRLEAWPAAFATPVRAWLRRFHVQPRTDLVERFAEMALRHGLRKLRIDGCGAGYAVLSSAEAPAHR